MIATDSYPLIIIGTMLSVILLWVKLFYGFEKHKGHKHICWLLAAFLFLAGMIFMTSYEPWGKAHLMYRSQRYFIPLMLIALWIFILHIDNAKTVGVRGVYGGLLCAALVASWAMIPKVFMEYPDWRSELAQWRNNPQYVIKTSPPNYYLILQPKPE